MNQTIGEQIAYWRKERGLTQSELAQKVGVAGKTVISGYEKGFRTPSAVMINKIANALDCDIVFKLVGR